jgi:putative acetyltransferase
VIVEVRPEQPGDHAQVHDVHARAFGDNEAADLVDLLRSRNKAVISLVAVSSHGVVGHILFSPITISNARPDFRGLGLAPLGVLPEFQKRGVGSRLTEAGLESCRQLNYDAVVVLGHPTYYPRFGFTKASASGLGNEYNAEDAFMVVELRPGALLGIEGLVQYSPEFREMGL